MRDLYPGEQVGYYPHTINGREVLPYTRMELDEYIIMEYANKAASVRSRCKAHSTGAYKGFKFETHIDENNNLHVWRIE